MGTLYIVSTPIGNLEDITLRALRILFSVDVIAAEDTRRTGLLLSELKKRYSHLPLTQSQLEASPKLTRYDNHTEQNATAEIVGYLENGKDVALVSDAGTPLLSDPGFFLVREAKKRNIPVFSIPGASSILTALTSSGLPAESFMYLGFPPEKQSHRIKLITTLPRNITLVFLCAPHKFEQLCSDLYEVHGDIEITIARELTKLHEEVWTGTITEAKAHFQPIKGEIVVLIHLP